jgi:uncharacterized protein YjbI with pentapeptide repeats
MAQNESRKKALVIAVSEYEEGSNLKNLLFCKKDGEDLYELLQKKEFGYEIKGNEGLIGKVDGEIMRKRINEFFEDPDMKSSDTLLFYYTGHGIARGERHYFASSNIDQQYPGINGLRFSDLTDLIRDCRAKCVVTVLDCCYAGAAAMGMGGDTSQLQMIKNNQKDSFAFKQGEGRCLLSSCDNDEESYPHQKGQHSFFTHYLLEALKGANGDSVNDDGFVTPQTIANYIDKSIDNLREDRPAQTPLLKIDSGIGEIKLAHHENLVRVPQEGFDDSKGNKHVVDLLAKKEVGKFKEFLINHRCVGYNLKDQQIDGAFPDSTSFNRWNFDKVTLVNVIAPKLNFLQCDFHDCNFINSDFYTVDLSESYLTGTSFKNVSLKDSFLLDTKLIRAIIEDSNFSGMTSFYITRDGLITNISIVNSIVMNTKFTNADFRSANLSNTVFAKVDLKQCRLDDAVINHAVFLGKMELDGMRCKNANFENSVTNNPKLIQYLKDNGASKLPKLEANVSPAKYLYGEKPELIEKCKKLSLLNEE